MACLECSALKHVFYLTLSLHTYWVPSNTDPMPFFLSLLPAVIPGSSSIMKPNIGCRSKARFWEAMHPFLSPNHK